MNSGNSISFYSRVTETVQRTALCCLKSRLGRKLQVCDKL